MCGDQHAFNPGVDPIRDLIKRDYGHT